MEPSSLSPTSPKLLNRGGNPSCPDGPCGVSDIKIDIFCSYKECRRKSLEKELVSTIFCSFNNAPSAYFLHYSFIFIVTHVLETGWFPILLTDVAPGIGFPPIRVMSR